MINKLQQLALDKDAERVFVGDYPVVLKNCNWQVVEKNI